MENVHKECNLNCNHSIKKKSVCLSVCMSRPDARYLLKELADPNKIWWAFSMYKCDSGNEIQSKIITF